jgi:hypothetical protein
MFNKSTTRAVWLRKIASDVSLSVGLLLDWWAFGRVRFDPLGRLYIRALFLYQGIGHLRLGGDERRIMPEGNKHMKIEIQ